MSWPLGLAKLLEVGVERRDELKNLSILKRLLDSTNLIGSFWADFDGNCFRGALPRVDLRAVHLVRAINNATA